MTPSRIDALAEQIKRMERRVITIAMSESDHKLAEQELVRLRAEFWIATMELGRPKGVPQVEELAA